MLTGLKEHHSSEKMHFIICMYMGWAKIWDILNDALNYSRSTKKKHALDTKKRH